MAAENERAFSQGRLTVTQQRHRLHSDVIEYTQCLKNWLLRLQNKTYPLFAAKRTEQNTDTTASSSGSAVAPITLE